MQVERKYEQWKANTESDFVTLFIKTWFTFIAVLRGLNPDVDVFTEDGMPRGDKPFLNAYKEGIMPIVQKNINTDDFAQELFAMYPISMRKVMDKKHDLALSHWTLQDAIEFAEFTISATINSMKFQKCKKTVGDPIDILVLKPEGASWIRQKELHAADPH